MKIRNYQPGDHTAIADVFHDAVHQIACEAYTPEQCAVWASHEIDYEHWLRRCDFKRPLVAVIDNEVAGFLELDSDGHIDCAYVNPKYQRQGVMSRMVQHAVELCFQFKITRVYVEASICAKPMFEKLGFTLISENVVYLQGVELINFKMELLKPGE